MAKPPVTRAYTTRSVPVELIDRMRVLASAKTMEDRQRITLEQIVNEALRRGIPLLEREIL